MCVSDVECLVKSLLFLHSQVFTSPVRTGQAVADDPLLRLAMFDAGARMLAPSMMAAEVALAKVGRTGLTNYKVGPSYNPICSCHV
jgi:hypothetical protein